MSFWIYMLHCADRSYYVGHTEDLDRRIAEHQSGVIRGYTYERRPLELVWSENFQTRAEAQAAESRIKKWSRAKKEALFAEHWERLKALAVPPHERSARAGDGQEKDVSASLDIVPRLRSGKTGEAGGFQPNPQPAIILVRPQLGENIGKAARAMLNFGLTELRLVAPRDGWPNPDAGPSAAGADIVLEKARVFETLAQATADCTQVFATTVRKRDMVKAVVTPEEAARQAHELPGKAAFVFGPERSGLETEEVAMARAIMTVPVNPDFGSLNLAQAVILAAYEWSKYQPLVQPTAYTPDPPAPQEELDGLFDHLESMLEQTGYFFPPDRAPTTRRTLRLVLTKPAWSANEIRALRGVLSAIQRPRPK